MKESEGTVGSKLGARAKPKPIRDRDGLHKRRGIWHYKLKVDGRWREISTGTRSYKDAQQVRRKALQAQEEGRLPTDKSKLKLEQALPSWLDERRQLKSRSTWKVEQQLSTSLVAALGKKPLCDITNDDIRRYQITRSKSVSAHTVNKEVRILRSILQQCRLWGRLAYDFRRLKEKKPGLGRALSDDEEKRLFETASRKEAWQAAYYAGLLAANTTARGCELKGLRLKDVDLEAGTMRIRSTKTDAGRRVVPLNPTASWAVARLLERAQTAGAVEPEHYLFPACERGRFDATKPQTTWRTAWRSLTKEAGLQGLRFHDLRHHGITKLAEAGVPDQTLMAIAGHVSREMLEHYSHVRQQAKREAVQSIAAYIPPLAAQTDEEASIN